MPSPHAFRELVSGRRRGASAALARAGLRVAEIPYAAAVRWRNRRYDSGHAEIHRASVPVISVGNLTLGGTGKTPMVEWLCRWFRDRQVRVAIVSRGYAAQSGAANDERLELEEKLVDVPHVQNPDRFAGATLACEEFDSQVIVLDDGFQHRRLDRDLDIVLLDALDPFGGEHVFPRGMLREPIDALSRADVVVLSRADAVDEEHRDAIRARVGRAAPQAFWAEARHAPRSLRGSDGQRQPLDAIAGRRVAAFCGIGNPDGFRHTLDATGAKVVDLREFPDHHHYDRNDVERLRAWAAGLDVAVIVCTHKDLVKIRVDRLADRPLWALEIGLDLSVGRALLEEILTPFVAAPVDG